MSNHSNPAKHAPFSCRFSPNLPELLLDLNCSLAITTYQAGKLVFISPRDREKLVQLPRSFAKPMGLARHPEKDKLALACKDEVVVFANSTELARFYPKKPDTYDALYLPRCTFHTGPLDIHDLSFGSDDRLFAVNTLFSCLVELDSDYSFKPHWQPPFIDRLVSEDRCHLNGMAMQDGRPRYVTAFNTGNAAKSWRANPAQGGVVIDVEQNEIIASGLAMPHSPRLIDGKLYVLLSATGELISIDPDTRQSERLLELGGFVRGMDHCGDFLFIGLSKLRKNSSSFGKLAMAKKAREAGVVVVHLPSRSVVAKISYLSSVDEIYDVRVIPGKRRPNMLNPHQENVGYALSLPDTTFWSHANQNPTQL